MTNTPNPQANTLDEQIRKAIKAYKIAGGDPEFYIISKSDHDRNWAQAVTEARIDEHMKWVLPTTEQALEWEQSEDGSGIQYFDNERLGRLTQLKENK